MVSILPRDYIQSQIALPIAFSAYDRSSLDRIVALQGDSVFSCAMSVWNRIVEHRLLQVDPNALHTFVNQRDPLVYMEIERLIGRPIIMDIHYSQGIIRETDGTVFEGIELLVAQVFPNNFHLCDILLQNPLKPLPVHLHSDLRGYRGFNATGRIIENMLRCARSRQCEFLTLVAATSDVAKLFQSHGFQPEKGKVSQLAQKMGRSIPMERRT